MSHFNELVRRHIDLVYSTALLCQKSLSDLPAAGCLVGEMQEQSDAQLLHDYAERGHEPAFRETVRPLLSLSDLSGGGYYLGE